MSRSLNPLFVHAGDLLSRVVRGELAEVEAILDLFVRAGYHGPRTWTCLLGAFWRGRDVGPWQGDAYVAGVRWYQEALRARGLKWMVSQGDLWLLDTPGREAVRRVLLDTLDREIIGTLDAANEPENNGGASPEQLVDWLKPFAGRWPDVVYTLGSPVSEERDDLDAYTAPPADCYDVHSWRAGDDDDKVRHIYNTGYESAPVRLGVQSEPCGPGSRVSVGREDTPETLALMALAAIISRQAYCYFCGPGIISNESESFAGMPGFWEVPRAVALLPADVMRWSKLVHGGARDGSLRVFAVPGTDDTRADHAIEHADGSGRFVCLLYGPRWRECRQVRPAELHLEQDFGDVGRLVIGRV